MWLSFTFEWGLYVHACSGRSHRVASEFSLHTFTCTSFMWRSFDFDALWNSLHTIVFFVQMNVVMPTAMSSMHTDPELSANAARTARRGIRVLKYLQDKNESVKTNCDAIRAVAAGGDTSTENCEERVEVSRQSSHEAGPVVSLWRRILASKIAW